MLKVLIADDEIKVCQLIRFLVDWDSLGLEVIGCVNDGVSAYKFIMENNPDIVITDIRMPEYDGIELIRKTKENNPNIHFIIISGFSHFEYAHNAIKYGVEDYLLKPIKKKDLLETLNKIIEKHNEKTLIIIEKADMQHRINIDTEKMKRNLLNEMISKPDKLAGTLGREKINEEYHCSFVEGVYQAVIFKPSITFSEENEQSYALLMAKTEDIVSNKLKAFCQELITTIDREGIFCIVNGSNEELQEFQRQLKKIRCDITCLRDVFLNVKVTIGVGNQVNNIRDIFESLDSARLAALNRLVMGTGHVIEACNTVKAHASAAYFADNQFRSKLAGYIEILDSDGIRKCVDEIKQKVMNFPEMDGKLIFEVYKEIVDTFVFGMKNCDMTVKDASSREMFIKEFHFCSTPDEVFGQLADKMAVDLNEWSEEKKQAAKKPIRIAKQYIQNNYNLPLSLEKVSEQIGFNPAYFSSVFKKETGKNFTEYLAEIRIQNAKQLLIDTDNDVFDIAETVGYSNLKYFSKLFKKLTGLNPSEYRKLYG